MRKVAILGSGNIGCDLLVKCLNEEEINVVVFSGRHPKSRGLEFASKLGVRTTDRSIEGIIETNLKPHIIFDATSADYHEYNFAIAKNNGIKVIDMTPAKLGKSCCPVVNINDCLNEENINMISCGGQAAIPICNAIKITNQNLNYIEIVSTISSASAGPGTRRNISQYITSTQEAIKNLLHIPNVKVIINITPALPPIDMKTTILIDKNEVIDIDKTWQSIKYYSDKTRKYAPGYKNSLKLSCIGEKLICQVKVTGSGDYLPKYAGNLDIINCAAIEVLKRI